MLERGNLLYLLDGLDEVADPAQRERVARWIAAAQQADPTSRFVVTCRFAGYSPSAHLGAAFLELHLRPLTEEQVEAFVGEAVKKAAFENQLDWVDFCLNDAAVNTPQPFEIFNLLAGASHLGFRQFMVGSLLGLAPGQARSRSFRAPSGGDHRADLGKPIHCRGGGARANRSRAFRQTLAALRLREGATAMPVGTYNVHDCVGRDGRFDPGRIGEVLVEIEPDVVALQKITLDRDRVGDLAGIGRYGTFR